MQCLSMNEADRVEREKVKFYIVQQKYRVGCDFRDREKSLS